MSNYHHKHADAHMRLTDKVDHINQRTDAPLGGHGYEVAAWGNTTSMIRFNDRHIATVRHEFTRAECVRGIDDHPEIRALLEAEGYEVLVEPLAVQVTRYLIAHWLYRGEGRWQIADQRGPATIDTAHMGTEQLISHIAYVEGRDAGAVADEVTRYPRWPLTADERTRMAQEAA